MRTIETILYTFDELNDKAKQKAINTNRYINTDYYEWFDCTIEYVTEALEKIGFSDVKIMFSGFSSQGDGACFTGKYCYQKGALKAIKTEYPQWAELHTFCEELQTLERKDFYSIRFEISHTGSHCHENATRFDFEDTRNDYGKTIYGFDGSGYKESCRTFMKHIYRSLESEYDELTSDEAVIDAIKSNEYEFLENGANA